MSKQTKSILLNFLGFVVIFFPFKYVFDTYSGFSHFQCLGAAFITTLILSPKFQVVKTSEGEKLFMKWMFIKDVKEIK